MEKQKRGYFDVDSLQQQLVAAGDVVGRIASFYNVPFPTLHKTQPRKFKFVKGFHRGQEHYGLPQVQEFATLEQLQQTGIILVEGPNDAMNLHSLGIPALAVCSNLITETQLHKLATMANEIPGCHVSVMFDFDQEGENGVKQTELELAKLCNVKLAWHSEIGNGQLKGKQPESMIKAQWEEINQSIK